MSEATADLDDFMRRRRGRMLAYIIGIMTPYSGATQALQLSEDVLQRACLRWLERSGDGRVVAWNEQQFIGLVRQTAWHELRSRAHWPIQVRNVAGEHSDRRHRAFVTSIFPVQIFGCSLDHAFEGGESDWDQRENRRAA